MKQSRMVILLAIFPIFLSSCNGRFPSEKHWNKIVEKSKTDKRFEAHIEPEGYLSLIRIFENEKRLITVINPSGYVVASEIFFHTPKVEMVLAYQKDLHRKVYQKQYTTEDGKKVMADELQVGDRVEMVDEIRVIYEGNWEKTKEEYINTARIFMRHKNGIATMPKNNMAKYDHERHINNLIELRNLIMTESQW